MPGYLLETPDILIAVDMNSVGAENWKKTEQFLRSTVESLAEYFRFGGCLDEMRVGVFQVCLPRLSLDKI